MKRRERRPALAKMISEVSLQLLSKSGREPVPGELKKPATGKHRSSESWCGNLLVKYSQRVLVSRSSGREQRSNVQDESWKWGKRHTRKALETISRSTGSRRQLRKIKISRLCVPEMWAEWNHHRNVPGQGLALREEKSAASVIASGYLGQWLNSKSFVAIQPLDKVITGAPAILTFRTSKPV